MSTPGLPIALRYLWLGVALLALALVARWLALDFLTDDVAYWVIPWYDFLVQFGVQAFGREFPNAGGWSTAGNYTPPYYYLLYVASWFDGMAPKLYLIKAISIVFDLIAAVFVFLIVRAANRSITAAWMAFVTAFSAPTVIANGSLWGQCDAIHTSLMLGAVLSALRGWPIRTIVLLGGALAVKGQAIFLFPFLLLLILRRSVPPWALVLIPATYVGLMLPAVAYGRPLVDLLTVYFTQASLYRGLSMNAANLYYFIPASYYDDSVVVGVGLTVVAALAFAALPRLRRVSLTPEILLLSATVSAAGAPFLLPRMHDRYFFAADLLSIALAFINPRLWPIAAGLQLSSLLSYVPIISDTLNKGAGEYRDLMPLAVAINCVVVGCLAANYGARLTAADDRTRQSLT